ncbi:MAG: UDP-N-acetylmuramate--L-alanine ligase [Oscillospiraceae bacterium]|nr:UDP-N-acetylmuramate--L-alanine ligase [Oscillospiraceae bacterium]
MKDIDTLLKEAKRVHFIGIGGAGMCPIAEILISLGYDVSGSDNNDTETFRRVEKEGAKVYLGQVRENITDDVELVIYTNAILAGNEELEYAKANFPCFERAEALGAISRIFSNCIGICGTHGKTTTTSMTTQILMEAGLDPSAVIGGKLPLINAYGRYGHSQNFVCESCEFNNTFLHMNPDIAVILNIDEDHLDFFKNLDNIKKSFRKFAELTTKTVIYNGDDENTVDTLKGLEGKKMISIGRNDGNEWVAKNVSVPGGFHSEYDAYHNGEFVAHVELSVPGEHNILNSLCAFVASYESGADVEHIKAGLKHFGGAARRFELLGKYNGVTFADDYAHHPKEIKVTLEAAKKMGYNHVWAVHQPFTYTRTSLLLNDFAKVLQIADKCVISKIMGSREVNTIGIKAKDLADKVPGSVQLDSFEEICDYVCDNAEDGDLVITLGCGDVYKVARMMCKKMKEKEENGI